jgi:hypothetical protein
MGPGRVSDGPEVIADRGKYFPGLGIFMPTEKIGYFIVK